MDDFWNNIVGVSEEAARMQVAIISSFSPEKKSKIASDFLNLAVDGTRAWIKRNHPYFSEQEVTLEFVRTQSYELGRISQEHWDHFRTGMERRIRKEWAARFRAMMKAEGWTYDDVAQIGGFKNGAVVRATVSRGLPGFAKVAVVVWERRTGSS